MGVIRLYYSRINVIINLPMRNWKGSIMFRASVALWAKCWPANGPLGSIPIGGGNLFNHERGSVVRRISFHPHRPDKNKILVERT